MDKIKNQLKIGIITLHVNTNYGNRLQAYALQKILKDLDCQVEEIVPITKRIERIEYNDRKHFSNLMKEREEIFKVFTNNFVPFREFRFSKHSEIKALNKEYDLFIAGSDQVWNPFLGREFYSMLLEFADYEKSASYAASISIPMLPIWISWRYKRAFKRIKHLSLRENSGKKLVDRYLRKNSAQVHIDPTMLLTKEQWLDFCKEEKKETEPYVLTYFLGKEGSHKEEVENIVKNNDERDKLKIIHLNDATDEKNFIASPQKFVSLFSNASLVCTDSFHACVFSILFEKPFVIFNRKASLLNMNSRMKTLSENLKIGNRDYKDLDKDKIFDMNYDEINKNLENERKKGIDYLKLLLKEREKIETSKR